MFIHKAVLELYIGVLVNKPGIFVYACDCKLSEFGVGALDNGQDV